ncbi:hypothetical protein GCM10009809_26250 [Isoptericola hypogeus]|uniref:Uncharacterized protein n=1 Tax=Isoptericola hypogeus TaxID=300179 RepID=A0ABN2JJV8_9MICO
MHPPELTYPCCLPALGEFGEMMPHEGSADSLTETPPGPETGGGPGRADPRDHRHPLAIRSHPGVSAILLGLPAQVAGRMPGGFA